MGLLDDGTETLHLRAWSLWIADHEYVRSARRDWCCTIVAAE